MNKLLSTFAEKQKAERPKRSASACLTNVDASMMAGHQYAVVLNIAV